MSDLRTQREMDAERAGELPDVMATPAAQEPVFRFRDEVEPESYWPHEYVRNAMPLLDGFGWLARPATQADQDAAAAVLDGLDGLGLDEPDAYPFGLLWALRARGVLGEVDGLDEQLAAWRKWEEEDHLVGPDVGPDPLGFLPVLIPGDELARLDGIATELEQTRAEIRRLLQGTGHEVDDLDDRLAAGYTLHDAVTAALAAQDRLIQIIAAAENRSLRAEWALRRAGMPVLGERAGDWFLCGPTFLRDLPEGSCGHLPTRPAPDGLGHHHWMPRTDPSCGDTMRPAPGAA